MAGSCRKNCPGCATCCGGGVGTLTFVVKGCPGPPSGFPLAQPNAVVTVSKGGVNFSATTDALGRCSIVITSTGVWTFTIVPASARQATAAGSVTATTGTVFVPRTLVPDAGYACAWGCSTPAIAANMTWIASGGATGVATWNGSTSAATWTGGPPGAVALAVDDFNGGGCAGPTITTYSGGYGYTLDTGVGITLNANLWANCVGSHPSNGPGVPTTVVTVIGTNPTITCIPYSITCDLVQGVYLLTGTTSVTFHE